MQHTCLVTSDHYTLLFINYKRGFLSKKIQDCTAFYKSVCLFNKIEYTTFFKKRFIL